MNKTVINEQIKQLCRGSKVEVCGVIIGDEVIELGNKSSNPEEEFLMDTPTEYDAIFHSHPDGPFYPTMSDMISQEATAVPWAIYAEGDTREEVFWFGDTQEQPPLLKRIYRYGVTDCYEIIRDFYRDVHNIELPNFPRDWGWWDDDGDMYDRYFSEAGFHQIPIQEILAGDVVLCAINSKHSNHAAIYLGNDLILHHLSGRLPYDPSRPSVIEPAGRWMKYHTKVLRHEDDSITREVGQGIWPVPQL